MGTQWWFNLPIPNARRMAELRPLLISDFSILMDMPSSDIVGDGEIIWRLKRSGHYICKMVLFLRAGGIYKLADNAVKL